MGSSHIVAVSWLFGHVTMPSAPPQSRLVDVLQKYWGYEIFRPLQERAMQCVLEDRDSVVVLPTGGGKSLCFQAPAVCRDGLALVISPLISLMKDQVDALRQCGVPAAFVNSTLSYAERKAVAERIRAGELRLLYMAPERLLTERTLTFLRRSNVSFIAIDEAHCISEWGHDFRPEYRELRRLKEEFPDVAVHAYTATATKRVRGDIARQLQLNNPEMLVGSFDRPNLTYHVLQRGDAVQQVRDVLERHPGESGIVYCIRRDDVDHTAAMLSHYGYRALPYHAGMDAIDRKRHQDAFISEEGCVIVATIAFGMGIDKPNVRFVVHAGMPKSLENYQQESGRAGRDGLEAECCLIYSGGDFHTWKRMLSDLDGDAHQAAMMSLSKIYDYCTGVICRHRALVQHFGEQYEADNCGTCDVCLGDFETVDDPLTLGQKILSCVVRLNEQYGGDYTSQVLAGSQAKRILEREHNRLSTWGLLKNEDRRHIREWIEQLVGQGYLDKNGEYSTLSVTEAGWQVLRGHVTPKLLRPKLAEKSTAEQARRSRTAADSWEGVDEGLFETLRELRTGIAEERGVPPYVVFGDAALRDMARKRPTTPSAFLNVRGVGEQKCRDYADAFIARITQYCERNDLSTNVEQPEESATNAKTNAAPRERTPSKSELQAFPLFERGLSVAEVAHTMNRAESTVRGYLSQYIRHDKISDPTRWVDADVVQRVEAAVAEVGPVPLRPIYEALEETVSYNDIRIVVGCLRNRTDDTARQGEDA